MTSSHGHILRDLTTPLGLGLMASVLLSALALGGAPQHAFAQDEKEEYERPSPLDEGGSVIRRKLLYRSTRFEIAPLIGFTLADAYNRNILAGATAAFHLTNEFGIGVTFGYGVTTLATPLREAIEQSPEFSDIQDRRNLVFAKTNWLASAEGSYVPLVGKSSLFNSVTLNYDLHFLFGVGFVNQGAEASVEGTTPPTADQLSTSGIAPMLGVGMRFYAGDFMSVNLELRDYLFSSALIANRTVPETELNNNLMLSIGLSFFLPTEVKVSR